jgi:hypothetical protein
MTAPDTQTKHPEELRGGAANSALPRRREALTCLLCR